MHSNRPERVLILKEVSLFFTSPAGYIVLLLFFSLGGWFFISPFFLADRADMKDFFSLLPLLFALIQPALTMGLFSAEYRSGHMEILRTQPVSSRQILTGKYLAGLIMTALLLFPTSLYPLSISLLGDMDAGPVWSGYLGALLLGGTYSAIGLFFSAMTKNQLTAFLCSAASCTILALADDFAVFMPPGIRGAVNLISADTHFQPFLKGLVDLKELLYFLTVSGFFLLLTEEVLYERQ